MKILLGGLFGGLTFIAVAMAAMGTYDFSIYFLIAGMWALFIRMEMK